MSTRLFLALTFLSLLVHVHSSLNPRALFESQAELHQFPSDFIADGVQCLTNFEERVKPILGPEITLSSVNVVSIERLLSTGLSAMSTIDLIPCISASMSFVEYWNQQAKQTDVLENFKKHYEEIFMMIGVILNPTTYQEQANNFLTGFFTLSARLLDCEHSRPSFSPLAPLIIPNFSNLDSEKFWKEFLSGFLDSIGLKNTTLVQNMTQCAIDAMNLFKQQDGSMIDLVERVAKTVESCSSAKKMTEDYFGRNALKENSQEYGKIFYLIRDLLTNFRSYKGFLMRSFELYEQKKYESFGRKVGAIFRPSFTHAARLRVAVY